tara:strand:- start:1137 stop:1373 length:237 start_codon:yes stop_codon:yes gene_type:complete
MTAHNAVIEEAFRDLSDPPGIADENPLRVNADCFAASSRPSPGCHQCGSRRPDDHARSYYIPHTPLMSDTMAQSPNDT